MPGSILVSVLGVEDLPSSSLPSSSLSSEPSAGGLFSLKLVLGKTEYQTADKGDFSFPVRSIRDSLRLILFDSGGNEISRSDVRVMEVVEKRSLDSLFPLEGGGHVHLKLRFTLNAEEHKRINEMREAVLKRKRAELLKSISMDRASDYIDREKIFMFSSSQKVQQLPDFHSEVDALQPERQPEFDLQQPEAYSKVDSPIREKIFTFSPSQEIQQLPDFRSKIEAQRPENLPELDTQLPENIPKEDSALGENLFSVSPSQKIQQLFDFRSEMDTQQPVSCPEVDTRQADNLSKEDSRIRETIITFSPSQEIQQLPDFHSEIDSRQLESHPEVDTQQPGNLPKEDSPYRDKIMTVFPSQEIQELPDFPSEIDARQLESHPEVDTQHPGDLPKEDSPYRDKIMTVFPSQEIQELPDFPSEIDARQLESHPEVDTQHPGDLPKEDSPYRDKIMTVFPSQEIQELPDFPSEIDARQLESHPEVDTQHPGDLPKEDSPFREKIVTFLPSQEIQQRPDFHTEIDAQQPDLPKEDSGQDECQLNTQRLGHPFDVDSQIKDHRPDLDAQKGENNVKFESVNHSEEKIEVLVNPSSQIEEAIDPPLKSASRSPEMVQEITESSSLMDQDHEKSPARGVKKMISTFESISSKEPKSWMRRVERADSTRAPWQERLSTERAKSGGTMSKSLSTGSISSLKLRNLNLIHINAREEEKHCDVAANEKTLEDKQQFPEPENHQNFPNVESFCREKNDSLEEIQTKEVVIFCRTVDVTEDVKKLPSPEAKESTLESIASSDAERTLTLIDNKEDKVAERDYLQSLDHTENISRQIVVDPKKIEDPCSSIFHPGQQDSIFGLVTEVKSNSKVNFLAYFDAEQCLVGSYGNRIPRHVCVTSGSKQLRDAVGCFSYL